MALSQGVVWEVRPTVGSDTNGGAFDNTVTSPGTDYSQQNSAQYAFTDGASSGTSFTSASHSFTSADVGNVMNISSGTSVTAGWYTIVSVSGGDGDLGQVARR